MRDEIRLESGENPVYCKVAYRRVEEAEPSVGECVSFSGGSIVLRGGLRIEKGQAAVVHLDAVKGLSPPLRAYIEIGQCDKLDDWGYRVTGVIKGICSE